MFSEIHDLGNLMNAIQNDSRLGFSTVSFLRRAISETENYMNDSCCVRGRQGVIFLNGSSADMSFVFLHSVSHFIHVHKFNY